MKLNNKGYLLVEIIVASVLAMIVAYFLIDITVKLKNSNDDAYADTILVTDKALMTNEVMSDINNYNLIEVQQNSNSSVKLTYANVENTFSKTLSINNNIFTYGDYSKEFSDDLTIQNIEIFCNSDGNCDTDSGILYINIPAYTNYSDTDYGINISIPYYDRGDIELYLPVLLEYGVNISSYQNITITDISEPSEVASYDWIYNSSLIMSEDNFPSTNNKVYTEGNTITISVASAGYYTLCLTTRDGDKVLKSIYIYNYSTSTSSSSSRSTSFAVNNASNYSNVLTLVGTTTPSLNADTGVLTISISGISYYSNSSGYEDCIFSGGCTVYCVNTSSTSGVPDLSWDTCSGMFSCSNGSFNGVYSVPSGSCSSVGQSGRATWQCQQNNCTPGFWDVYYYRTTALVEL